MKYRAYSVVKHSLADQLAHVERDRALVFDCAFAFRLTNRRLGNRSPATTRCHKAFGCLVIRSGRLLRVTSSSPVGAGRGEFAFSAQ